jgi:hypothetical protein
MDAQRRRHILERLNTLDAGPTEDERRAERRAAIGKAIETEQELRWGRLSAGIAGGIFGRSTVNH